MFSEKIIIKNEKLLKTISKFVDYKINSCKSTFRAKNDYIYIDLISKLTCQNLLNENDCKLFKKYNLYKLNFSVRQKEDKIFKFLLAQKLILLICEIEKELNQISTAIKRAKNAKSFKNYKKQLLLSAQIYSIKKFNPNSTKLLFKYDNDLDEIINKFFIELFEAEKKLKIIITYLSVMFS